MDETDVMAIGGGLTGRVAATEIAAAGKPVIVVESAIRRRETRRPL